MTQLFNLINIPFAYIMRFFDSFTGNYALTLLLFTLVIKLVFLPMGIYQQKNQIKMARLRPKEEVIRKKYAGRTDRETQQKMQQEILELQQKEKVSPFGGCLPLIVQLIVIMSVYYIIREPLTYLCGLGTDALMSLAKEFNWQDAKGLFVGDAKFNLSTVDQINAIGAVNNSELTERIVELGGKDAIPNLNLFGLNLGYKPQDIWNAYLAGERSLWEALAYAIIPVACFLLQVFTMKMTRKFTYQSPVQQDAQTGCSMKMMDWTMPLMSLFFCFTFSSAIGLYWIYSNIFSFGQTVLLAKLMPVPRYTEEDIKAAEKEMKSKGFETKRSELKRVRSLHHIDDDDYETLPEIDAEVKGASQTLLNGEKVPAKSKENKPKIKD